MSKKLLSIPKKHLIDFQNFLLEYSSPESCEYALKIILEKKRMIIEKTNYGYDNPWIVRDADFWLDEFKTKEEAVSFCQHFDLPYDFWNDEEN